MLERDSVIEAIEKTRARYQLEPALEVGPETKVGDCISMMKSKSASCVLVNTPEGVPIGIFTDRDLFLKMSAGSPSITAQTPVSEVMSKPVLALPLELIHLAPDMMASKRIRHVPVLRQGANGRCEVIGLATMDHVFVGNLRNGKPFRALNQAPFDSRRSVGILSQDPFFSGQVTSSLNRSGEFNCREIKKGETMTPRAVQMLSESFRHLVIDVDGQDIRRLAKLLLGVRQSASIEKLILVFDTGHLDPGMRDLIQKLQETEGFFILPKPVGFMELSAVLSR